MAGNKSLPRNAVAEAENIVVETAERIFADLADAQTINHDKTGAWKAPLWQALSEAGQGSLLAPLFHLAFWHMDLSYFGRGLLGSWPQADAGVVLWSLSACADDWQSAEKLTRLCTIPEPAMLLVPGTKPVTRWRPESSDRCSGSDYWRNAAKRFQTVHFAGIGFIAKRGCSIDC